MANPPKKTGATTPPRRKAASRKATPPVVQPPQDGAEDAPVDSAPSAPPKKPAAKRASRSASAPAAPAKPRAAKRPAPVRVEAARQAVTDTRERMGDRNFFAAVIGATAALGAAITGIFLAARAKGGAADEASKPNAGHAAHQADGTDSTAQFEAGIADENMIPEKLPEG